MDTPRPEKVAVIDEVRERLEGASASVVTEYRGLSVGALAELRRGLAAAGAEYKVYKNTLVKRAIDGGAHAPLAELLVGPTAITFVHGDVSAVAKTLRDYSRANSHLVVKGGLLDGALLTPAQLGALADLPSRDVLLAQLAGAIAAPLTTLAGLIQALPRNLAYGLKALVDRAGGPQAGAAAPDPAPEPEGPDGGPQAAAAEPEPETPADEPAAETAEPETPADEPAAAAAPEAEAAAPAEEPAAAEPAE